MTRLLSRLDDKALWHYLRGHPMQWNYRELDFATVHYWKRYCHSCEMGWTS